MNAFPQSLSKDVEQVMKFLDMRHALQDIHTSENKINYKEEVLSIPGRIYFDQNIDSLEGGLTKVQRSILNCIGTRHFDGKVRERYLRKVMGNSEGFEIPFVFQLLGEYVVQIIEIIDPFIKDHMSSFLDFVIENPEYFRKTEDRMRSYWYCYYKREYPDITKYPGYKILNDLKK